MMDDLVAWLRAQLDDDDRVARATSSGAWSVDPHIHYLEAEDVYWDVDGESGGWVAHVGQRSDAEHGARWDPARVLAEVDAKRRIIDLSDKVRAWTDASAGATAGYAAALLADTLRLLALPYADRPGYRPEWRP
jgi:hypothetical protein